MFQKAKPFLLITRETRTKNREMELGGIRSPWTFLWFTCDPSINIKQNNIGANMGKGSNDGESKPENED